MLEKPDLEDEIIITCTQDAFGLNGVQVDFLPLGADQNAVVYPTDTNDDWHGWCQIRKK
jgi:hypothetical protein